MNRDNIVSIEPTNTLQGMGFSLFNNPLSPSNLLQPQDIPLPKYLTLLGRIPVLFLTERKFFISKSIKLDRRGLTACQKKSIGSQITEAQVA